MHPDLKDCSHVFLRTDRNKTSLVSPYEGPYKVLERSEKVFKIQLDDRAISVSIDRLKPAYLLEENDPKREGVLKSNLVTKSGRIVKKPVRFLDA